MAAIAAIDIDWGDKKAMKTVDRDPGGSFKWDPKTGRVEVCDIEPDGHLVRGRVTLNGEVVRATDGKPLQIRAGENDKCYVKGIKNYKRSKKYGFEICLALSDEHEDGHCNTSNSRQWPEVDIEDEGYCHHRSSKEERLKCAGGEKKRESQILEPPKAPKKSDKYFLTHKPDSALPRGHAKGTTKVAETAGILLRWLTWFAAGGCVLGLIMVGGMMAIKHKRGEFGAHATGMGWVLIACVVVGSGFALAFIALLVDPL
ncbi:hypothetical protein [Actinomadura sp. B10D3]|uniref:hypothetical protein n=1 Tax=Actinomadura sp. B10D3 TaxID=3153557 RepID=UPI00325D930F